MGEERCYTIAQVPDTPHFLKLQEVSLDNYLEDRWTCLPAAGNFKALSGRLYFQSSLEPLPAVLQPVLTASPFIFQNDIFLRHYDRGPCRNKLGHSRASVMWNRTQVRSWSDEQSSHACIKQRDFTLQWRTKMIIFMFSSIFLWSVLCLCMHTPILFSTLAKYVFFTTMSFRLWGSSLD